MLSPSSNWNFVLAEPPPKPAVSFIVWRERPPVKGAFPLRNPPSPCIIYPTQWQGRARALPPGGQGPAGAENVYGVFCKTIYIWPHMGPLKPNPCLINDGIPNGKGFFRRSKQICAGGLSPGKKMQPRVMEKYPPSGCFDMFQTRPRDCLKTGKMPGWGRLFCQAGRLDAGILTDFKSNQPSPDRKRYPKTAF